MVRRVREGIETIGRKSYASAQGQSCQLRKPVPRPQLYADPDYSTFLHHGARAMSRQGREFAPWGTPRATGAVRRLGPGLGLLGSAIASRFPIDRWHELGPSEAVSGVVFDVDASRQNDHILCRFRNTFSWFPGALGWREIFGCGS